MTMKSPNPPAQLTMPSDREIVITRTFRARRELVFEAHSKAEHVKRWFGLRHLTMPVCEMDFRVGGAWRYVLHDPNDGADHPFSGEYQAIVRPEQIVYTERYEPIPGSDHLVSIHLSELGGATTLTSHVLYPSKEQRDGHIMSGMEAGMQETFHRLDELLESLAAPIQRPAP